MANTERRKEYTDRNGGMFIPMNVEGGTWSEHFIDTKKFILIVLIILSIVALIIYLGSIEARLFAYIVYIGIWAFLSSLILRYIVFEEKFFYKMYLELKDNEITTPALFWDVASIKDTDDGAIITYSDAKIAAILKVERDTITGKQSDFKETHYDSISDFYKELCSYRLSFIQMNIMEQAGKDPRLNELSKVVHKSDNDNICKLMEMQVGHIKNITRRSLYEMDYFLIYTNDPSRVDTIIQDITDSVYKLLDGAYSGYRILTSREIVELIKEQYGVNYFNATQASLYMFQQSATIKMPPFEVTGILWKDGVTQELNAKEKNKLRSTTSKVVNGDINYDDIALKDTLYREISNSKIGIDLDNVDTSTPIIRKGANKNSRQQGRNRNKNQNSSNNQEQVEYISNNIYGDPNNITNDEYVNVSNDDDEIIDL